MFAQNFPTEMLHLKYLQNCEGFPFGLGKDGM